MHRYRTGFRQRMGLIWAAYDYIEPPPDADRQMACDLLLRE